MSVLIIAVIETCGLKLVKLQLAVWVLIAHTHTHTHTYSYTHTYTVQLLHAVTIQTYDGSQPYCFAYSAQEIDLQ